MNSRLRPDFEDQIERRLRDATEPAQPGELGDADVGSPLARSIDRLVIRVEDDERRRGIALGHVNGARAVPAADVGDANAAVEFGLDAVECRNPGSGEEVDVAGPEEPLAAGV